MNKRCPKCSGYLLPDSDRNGKVTAAKCFACGYRIWKGFTVRTPSRFEMAAELKQSVTPLPDPETVIIKWVEKWQRQNDRGSVFIVRGIEG